MKTELIAELKMDVTKMTKEQRSLLLYLETRAVDHGGLVDMRHVSEDDMNIVDAWVAAGYIDFGRVRAHDIARTKCSHWVEIRDVTLQAAHAERQARMIRMFGKRLWQKTTDKTP